MGFRFTVADVLMRPFGLQCRAITLVLIDTFVQRIRRRPSVNCASIDRPDRRWRRCVQPMPHVRRRHHPESRENWIAALDRLAALNPAIVVAGHKKTGAPDSPSTIQDTKRYLQDF